MIDKIQSMLDVDYKITIVGLPLDTKLADLAKQDASFDSLNVVSFLIEIENKFNIELPAKLSTLRELVEQLERHGVK